MGRKAVLAGFWFIGFAIGFIGYLIYPAIAEALMRIFPLISETVIFGAILAGIASGIITTSIVLLWGYLSSRQ